MHVITLTMNPVLDKSTATKLVLAEKKIQCDSLRLEPGGGGLNVSRAIKKLGGNSTAYFLAGGNSAKKISGLLGEEEVNNRIIDSGIPARENLVVYDKTTGRQYRFGMPGNRISEEHWKKALETIQNASPKPRYIVASGSLPPGTPDDFYARIAHYAKNNDIRLIIDTKGEPLKIAVEEGGVYMIKPNLREMANLVDAKHFTGLEQEEAASKILSERKCEVIVLSMGERGVMLAITDYDIEYIVPPTVPKISAVGAGDSMVAGILTAFSKGMLPGLAVRYGVAAGTAAVMTPGSELCKKEDTERIFNWLSEKE